MFWLDIVSRVDAQIVAGIVLPAVIVAGLFGAIAICVECTRNEGGF